MLTVGFCLVTLPTFARAMFACASVACIHTQNHTRFFQRAHTHTHTRDQVILGLGWALGKERPRHVWQRPRLADVRINEGPAVVVHEQVPRHIRPHHRLVLPLGIRLVERVNDNVHACRLLADVKVLEEEPRAVHEPAAHKLVRPLLLRPQPHLLVRVVDQRARKRQGHDAVAALRQRPVAEHPLRVAVRVLVAVRHAPDKVNWALHLLCVLELL